MYFLSNGDVVTADEIKAAFAAGKARLICSYGARPSVALDGKDWDTRGATYPNGTQYNMSEQSWTYKPDTVADLLQAAYAKV